MKEGDTFAYLFPCPLSWATLYDDSLGAIKLEYSNHNTQHMLGVIKLGTSTGYQINITF